MRLVAGRSPRTQPLEREHHLDRVEQADHRGQLGGREAAGQPHELRPRHVDVDEQPGEGHIGERHGLGSDLEIDAVGRDEAIERVEALARLAVELCDDTVLDDERRRWIAGSVHGHEAERRVGADQRLAPERRLRAHTEALAAGLLAHPAGLSWPRSAITTAASRTNAAQRGAADVGEVLRDHLELRGRGPSRPQRRVDGQHLVVRQRRELGGALEVLGQLLPARPRGRRPPGAAGSAAWRAARRARSRPERRPSSVTSASGVPAGVVTSSGRRSPSG